MSNYRTHVPRPPDGPLCGGKATHVTGAKAWAAAKALSRPRRGRSRDDEPPARPYRCARCGLYHLGRR